MDEFDDITTYFAPSVRKMRRNTTQKKQTEETFTSSVIVTQVRKAPYISKPDSIPDTREKEI